MTAATATVTRWLIRVHDDAEFRFAPKTSIASRLHEPRHRRKALDDTPTVIAGIVLAIFAGTALGVGVTYEVSIHQRPTAPVVHTVPKPTQAKVYRYWVHIGPSSLRIGV